MLIAMVMVWQTQLINARQKKEQRMAVPTGMLTALPIKTISVKMLPVFSAIMDARCLIQMVTASMMRMTGV